MMSQQHRFLISMPDLRGSYFGDTLTYLCRHDENGAFGLVVNRPLDLTLTDLLGQLDMPTEGAPDRVAVEGGPVEPRRGFVLHTSDKEYDSSEPAGDGLLLSYDRDVLAAIGAGEGPGKYLVALGFAGWGAGQLEQELSENVWLTGPSSKEVIFDAAFDSRLNDAAAAIGVDLRLLSNATGLA